MKKLLLRVFVCGLFCFSLLVNAKTPNNHDQYLSLLKQSNAFISQFLPINYDLKQDQKSGVYSLKNLIEMKIEGERFDLVIDEKGTLQSLNNQTIVNSLMDFYLTFDLQEGAVRIPLLEGGNHHTTIDHNNKTYRSTVLYENVGTDLQRTLFVDDKPKIFLDDEQVYFSFFGDLSLLSLKSNYFYQFDKDFNAIIASQSRFELNDFSMKIDEDDTVVTIASDQFSLESDYKKYEKTFSFKGVGKEMAIRSPMGSMIIPTLQIDLIIDTEGERSEIQSEYWAEDVQVAKEGKELLSFGSVKYKRFAAHLEDFVLEEYFSMLANVVAAQIEQVKNEDYQQLLPLVKQFFTSVTDQTEFGGGWELVSASGEKAMMTATAQLKDKNLLLDMSSKKDFQAWVDNVKNLKFKLTVSENYLVEQYLNYLQLIKEVDKSGLDVEEKKIKALIDKNYLLIMRLAPKGTKLIVREQGDLSITVDYQNETWNINGDSYHNDKLKELFDL